MLFVWNDSKPIFVCFFSMEDLIDSALPGHRLADSPRRVGSYVCYIIMYSIYTMSVYLHITSLSLSIYIYIHTHIHIPIIVWRWYSHVLMLWHMTVYSEARGVRKRSARSLGRPAYTHIYLSIYISLYVCIYIYIYMFLSLSIYIYIHIYIYICVYMCIYIYIYAHVYT